MKQITSSFLAAVLITGVGFIFAQRSDITYAADAVCANVASQTDLTTCLGSIADGETATVNIVSDFNITQNNNIAGSKTIVIEGNNHTLMRATTAHLFSFGSATGSPNLTIQNLTLDGNRTDYGDNPAGRLLRNASNPNATILVKNSVFKNNIIVGSGQFGSAIDILTGQITITDTTITNNTALSGGGVSIRNSSVGIINGNTVISNNTSTASSGAGGGLECYDGGQCTISGNVQIVNNSAVNFGGGIYVGSSTSGQMSSLVISENVLISDNTAPNGGGVGCSGLSTQAFQMSGGTISENTATRDGGGLWINVGGTVCDINITGGTFSNNTAARNGGAIGVMYSKLAQVNVGAGVTFSGNSAQKKYYLLAADQDSYNTQVQATDFSLSTPYVGYNNYDIEYTNPVIVSFETNGGSAVAEQVILINTAAEEPTAPVREGYDFGGWFSDPGLTESYDFSALVGSDITIYAKWNIKSYVVQFVDSDGNVLSEQEVEYGSAATAPEPPMHDGERFIGWNKDFNKITGDLIVVAQYEPLCEYNSDLLASDTDCAAPQPTEPVVPGVPPTGVCGSFCGFSARNLLQWLAWI